MEWQHMPLGSDVPVNGMAADAALQILDEIEKALLEMRALAQMAADNPLTAPQRKRVQARIDYLKKEIDGIAAMLAPASETPGFTQ
jgi:hypothetical protein